MINKNNKWYSVVCFNQPDYWEHDKEYYMQMTQEDAVENCLDWFAEYHLDEADYIDDEKFDGTEFHHDVVEFISTNISEEGECTFPVLITCSVIPLARNTEDNEYTLWNVLVKSVEDCDALVNNLVTGKITLWPTNQ